MTTDSPIDDIRDYALGYLLIDFADIDLGDVGLPVTDEELAVFIEEDAKSRLGKHRCAQIIAQISADTALYQHWIILNESRLLDGPFQAAQPEATSIQVNNNVVTPFRSTRRALFEPRFNLATAAGLVIATLLSAIWLLPEHSEGPQIVVNKGEELQQKASQGTIHSTEGKAANTLELVKRNVQCAGPQGETQICYLTTEDRQHWLLAQGRQLHALPPPPINALNIAKVYTQGNNLLIEYVEGQAFKLILLRYSLKAGSWKLATVYQDSIHGGYFDKIVLDKNRLQYLRMDEAEGATETIQIPLDDAAAP